MQVRTPQLPPRAEFPGPQSDALDFDLRDIVIRVVRHKWILLGTMALVMGCAWMATQQMVSRYTANSLVLIEPANSNIVDIEAVVSGVSSDPESIHGEIIVLQSRELAEKTAEQMGLFKKWAGGIPSQGDSTFFRRINPLASLSQAWDSTFKSLSGEVPAPAADAESRRLSQDAAIVSYLHSGLQIQSRPESRVVDVTFTFENPELAAQAANALAEVYVRHTLDVKYAGTREANAWLNDRLVELRAKVKTSDEAVEQLRNGRALVEGRSAQVVSEQIAAINAQLIAAKSDSSQLASRLQQIETLRKGNKALAGSSEILNSIMVQSLRQELFSLERSLAELSSEYGDRHPKMINIRAEIADVKARINDEVGKIITGLSNELMLSEQRVTDLQAHLNKLTNEVGSLNKVETELRSLEREAEANRLLFQTFLLRHKETTIQEKLQQPDARIISRAQVPGAPSYPNKKAIFFGAFALSLVIGLGLVVLLEILDKSFRTAKQLESQTGLPTLGVVPQLSEKEIRGLSNAESIMCGSRSRFGEAMRLLHTHLIWSGDGKRAKTVLVTSSLPGEGKTTITLSLARRAAFLNQKTLIVDCDLRHPAASQALGLDAAPGLTDVLSGQKTLDEVLQVDAVSGANFVGTGSMEYDPVSLVQSQAMTRFMDEVSRRFDLVMLDSSPVLAVTEPRILARLVDRSLFVVRWGKTPRAVALEGLKQLRDFGAVSDGLVLSQVNLKEQAGYGYGEYGYYSGKMTDYYSG